MGRETSYGTIVEAEYEDDKMEGWGRVIHGDKTYDVAFFKDGKYDGYRKTINSQTGATVEEGLMKQPEHLLIPDSEIEL